MPRTYLVTVQNIIDDVRTLTQDTASPYRTSDSEVLSWLNDAIKSTVTLLPQLFTKTGTHTCTAGAMQTVINSRAHTLVDIYGLTVADYAALSAFNPGWQTGATGTATNWLRAVGEPLAFFTYPPQAGGESLTLLYVETPAELTATTDTVPLPETYAPALVQYCVAMVEMKDDEHVDTQRAQAAMTDYVGRIKGGA